MPRYLVEYYSCVCLWPAFVLVNYVKQMAPSNVGRHHLIHWGVNWTKIAEREESQSLTHTLTDWAGILFFSCPECSWHSGFHTWTKVHTIGFSIHRLSNYTTGFLNVHFACGRLWRFSNSITMWANNLHSISLFHLFFICLVCCILLISFNLALIGI